MCNLNQNTKSGNYRGGVLFHPLLTLIASTTDRELAKYVQFLKEENKILRSRIKGGVHTKAEERKRLIELGKALGRRH